MSNFFSDVGKNYYAGLSDLQNLLGDVKQLKNDMEIIKQWKETNAIPKISNNITNIQNIFDNLNNKIVPAINQAQTITENAKNAAITAQNASKAAAIQAEESMKTAIQVKNVITKAGSQLLEDSEYVAKMSIELGEVIIEQSTQISRAFAEFGEHLLTVSKLVAKEAGEAGEEVLEAYREMKPGIEKVYSDAKAAAKEYSNMKKHVSNWDVVKFAKAARDFADETTDVFKYLLYEGRDGNKPVLGELLEAAKQISAELVDLGGAFATFGKTMWDASITLGKKVGYAISQMKVAIVNFIESLKYMNENLSYNLSEKQIEKARPEKIQVMTYDEYQKAEFLRITALERKEKREALIVVINKCIQLYNVIEDNKAAGADVNQLRQLQAQLETVRKNARTINQDYRKAYDEAPIDYDYYVKTDIYVNWTPEEKYDFQAKVLSDQEAYIKWNKTNDEMKVERDKIIKLYDSAKLYLYYYEVSLELVKNYEKSDYWRPQLAVYYSNNLKNIQANYQVETRKAYEQFQIKYQHEPLPKVYLLKYNIVNWNDTPHPITRKYLPCCTFDYYGEVDAVRRIQQENLTPAYIEDEYIARKVKEYRVNIIGAIGKITDKSNEQQRDEIKKMNRECIINYGQLPLTQEEYTKYDTYARWEKQDTEISSKMIVSTKDWKDTLNNQSGWIERQSVRHTCYYCYITYIHHRERRRYYKNRKSKSSKRNYKCYQKTEEAWYNNYKWWSDRYYSIYKTGWGAGEPIYVSVAAYTGGC